MADDNKIKLGVEVDPEPGASTFERMVEDEKSSVRELGQVFDGVAQTIAQLGGDGLDIDTSGAQEALERAESAAREAASAVEAFGVAGAAGGKGAAEAASKAAVAIDRLEKEIEQLRAAGGDVQALEAQLAALREVINPIPPSLKAAEAAVAAFSRQAETGGKGAARAMGVAAVAVETLEADIRELAASGANVSALTAKLEGLRAQTARNVQAAGKMRAAQADATDSLRAATAGAGELSGNLGSLDGILRSVGFTSLGNFTEQALALQGAFLVTVAAAKQVYEVLDKLTKEAGNAWVDSVIRQDEALRVADGTMLHYAQNLRNVLTKEGYDVAAAGLRELISTQEEFEARLRGRRAAAEDLITRFTGDPKKVRDQVAAFLSAQEQITAGYLAAAERFNKTGATLERTRKSAEVPIEVLRREKAEVESLIKALEDLGSTDPKMGEFLAQLRELQGRLAQATKTAEDYRHEHEAILEAVGVKTPPEIQKTIESLLAYQREVEIAGEATSEQAGVIRAGIDGVRQAVARLPEDARAAFDDQLQGLSELEERYRHTKDVALAAFGVQTPEAVARSVDALRGFVAEMGGIGQVSQEGAAKVVASAQSIREAIALMPPEERAAAAATAQYLEGLTVAYGKAAQDRQKFAVDVLAAERAAAEEEKRLNQQRLEGLKAVSDALATTFAQLRQGLPDSGGAAQDVESLTKEIEALKEANKGAGLSLEELNRLGELEQRLAGAKQSAAAYNRESKQTALSAKEVDAALAGLVDNLVANKEGWAALTPVQQGAIKSLIGGLQQTAQEGGATGQVFEDTFGSINRVLAEAGQSLGSLSNDLARNGEGALDLRREFGRLEDQYDATSEAAQTLSEKQAEAMKQQELAAAGAEKLADRLEKAGERGAAGLGKVSDKVDSLLSLMTQLNDLTQQWLAALSQASLNGGG